MLLVCLFFSVSVECGGFRMCPVFYVLSSFAIISLTESEMVACVCGRACAGVRACVFFPVPRPFGSMSDLSHSRLSSSLELFCLFSVIYIFQLLL